MATRWYNHVLSKYRDDVINNNPLVAPILELDSPPFEEELSQALSKIKKRKAGGSLVYFQSSSSVEVQNCGACRILKLMQQVWKEGRIVGEWQDAVVVPVPKKGDLRHCDN